MKTDYRYLDDSQLEICLASVGGCSCLAVCYSVHYGLLDKIEIRFDFIRRLSLL
jgi:hypothetical protein